MNKRKAKIGKKPKRARAIDANQVTSPREPTDAEVQLEFDEASQVPAGARQLRLKIGAGPGPDLSGGDIDAAWDRGDAGEETVGGSASTPDQDIVEDLGKAAGLSYEDNEPLHTTAKLEGRDRKRWELNPVSSEDFQERRLSEQQSIAVERVLRSGRPPHKPGKAKSSKRTGQRKPA
jgi:Family of unknown function (DUF6335)